MISKAIGPAIADLMMKQMIQHQINRIPRARGVDEIRRDITYAEHNLEVVSRAPFCASLFQKSLQFYGRRFSSSLMCVRRQEAASLPVRLNPAVVKLN